jgi:Protein of unknown function (DUF2612)
MTTDEIAEYYANLLIMQYINLPRAFATVQALAKMAIVDQLPLSLEDAFSVETAVGVQLDVLGKYVGVTRKVQTFTALVTLSDDDFRILIKVKILTNNSGSSLKDIQDLIQVYFPGTLRVFDNQDMHMDYYFSATIGSVNLAEAFVRQGLLPKPMGVELGALIYVVGIDNMFGFRTYTLPGFHISGFNSYTSYDQTHHWLSYQDAIVE